MCEQKGERRPKNFQKRGRDINTIFVVVGTNGDRLYVCNNTFFYEHLHLHFEGNT